MTLNPDAASAQAAPRHWLAVGAQRSPLPVGHGGRTVAVDEQEEEAVRLVSRGVLHRDRDLSLMRPWIG